MKSIENEIKNKKEQVKKEKKTTSYFMRKFEMYGFKEDFEIAAVHFKKAQEIQLEINQLKALHPKCTEEVKTKSGYDRLIKDIQSGNIKPQHTRLHKELHIGYLATLHKIDNEITSDFKRARTAAAIIDEIIESELHCNSKIRLIKLFLTGKISTLEVDAILTNE